MDLVFSTCSPRAWNPHLELGLKLRLTIFAYHLETEKKLCKLPLYRVLMIHNKINVRFTSF